MVILEIVGLDCFVGGDFIVSIPIMKVVHLSIREIAIV